MELLTVNRHELNYQFSYIGLAPLCTYIQTCFPIKLNNFFRGQRVALLIGILSFVTLLPDFPESNLHACELQMGYGDIFGLVC